MYVQLHFAPVIYNTSQIEMAQVLVIIIAQTLRILYAFAADSTSATLTGFVRNLCFGSYEPLTFIESNNIAGRDVLSAPLYPFQ